jgi:NAD(P)H-quinone oxidoreductase subunit 5
MRPTLLHGWLIQVVSALTPISALLHAGIINLGDYLLLLFSPLLNDVPIALWLLLIVAGLITMAATLVKMTRISIKVRLVWSTIAQMSFMMLECTLSFCELALLHLTAHSCYKAPAFLASGDTVHHYLRKRYLNEPRPSALSCGLAFSGVVTVAALVIAVSGWPLVFSRWVLIAIALISLGAYQ